MSTPNRSRKACRGRVVKQTQFDGQLMRVEQLVQQFHELLEQTPQLPEDRERMCAKLWAIRLQQFPQVVHSLEWAMKKAMMRAFPLEANGP